MKALLKSILDAIILYLGYQPTVASITKPITKISTKLDTLAARKSAEAEAEELRAKQLVVSSAAKVEESNEAAVLARKFGNLVA